MWWLPGVRLGVNEDEMPGATQNIRIELTAKVNLNQPGFHRLEGDYGAGTHAQWFTGWHVGWATWVQVLAQS